MLGNRRETLMQEIRDDVAELAPAEFEAPKVPNLRIVQWNANGLATSLATLWTDLYLGSISILLIQEESVHYNPNFAPVKIHGYYAIHDPMCKTAIYIRTGTKHRMIPLELHSNGPQPEDTLYATAAAVRVQMNGEARYILLLNVLLFSKRYYFL
jgi:hypothetical protein